MGTTFMKFFWVLSVSMMFPAGMRLSGDLGTGNWETYRSEKFGYQLSYPAEMKFKAYFEGSSGDLIDRKSGRVLVNFEVWPADTCPQQPEDANAREIGIERAKTITQADGPSGSSYCTDPVSIREHVSHSGARIYELELTCMSESFPESDDETDTDPNDQGIDSEPTVKYEGKKGPTFFADISQPWRKRILTADPVGFNPLQQNTKDRIDPEALIEILKTLTTFPVEKPPGICIEDLRNPGVTTGVKPVRR